MRPDGDEDEVHAARVLLEVSERALVMAKLLAVVEAPVDPARVVLERIGADLAPPTRELRARRGVHAELSDTLARVGPHALS